MSSPAFPSNASASTPLERAEALLATRERRAHAELHAFALPAPVGPGARLLALAPDGASSFFATTTRELVGLEAATTLTATGVERFAAIRTRATALFSQLSDPEGAVRLFGGFAFQPGRAAEDPWRAFGEARFVLPRLTYERRGDGARFVLVLSSRELEDRGARNEALRLLERAHAALGNEIPATAALDRSVTLRERPESDWHAQVRAILDGIARGEIEKIVLARRVDALLPDRPDLPGLLERLRELAPECVRFALGVGSAVFLGATPERLVTKAGDRFETEAVAGSFPTGGDAPLRLLESAKDRFEQAIVLRQILDGLGPLALSLEAASTPELHVLRHVAHLRTRVRGVLRNDQHVLDLVERLHPTPAVAGAPTARALAWIAEHEPDERGWYAGPVGFFDARGDGEFVVALRSGVLVDRTLSLYAGCGIVAGSEPESELVETRWKLAALLGALGVSA